MATWQMVMQCNQRGPLLPVWRLGSLGIPIQEQPHDVNLVRLRFNTEVQGEPSPICCHRAAQRASGKASATSSTTPAALLYPRSSMQRQLVKFVAADPGSLGLELEDRSAQRRPSGSLLCKQHMQSRCVAVVVLLGCAIREGIQQRLEDL